MVILDLLLLRCSLVKEIWYNTIVNLIGILKSGLISSIGILQVCFHGVIGSSSASMFSESCYQKGNHDHQIYEDILL